MIWQRTQMKKERAMRERPVAVCALCAALAAWCCLGALAGGGGVFQAQMGDPNLDGQCDLLDIQNAIAQALQQRDVTFEADVDLNGAVDLFDIQHMINTALESGGLRQLVRGRLHAAPALRANGIAVWALSDEGELVTGAVDADTGDFGLLLRARNSWALAFVAQGEEGLETGTLEIPVDGTATCLLPLPQLSEGEGLDLGQLQFGERIQVGKNVRALVHSVNQARVSADTDGDGLPDSSDWLVRLATEVPGNPHDTAPLIERIQPCLIEYVEQLTSPDLADEDEDGVPDFVEPLITCLEEHLAWWLALDSPQDEDSPAIQHQVENTIKHILKKLPKWLDDLDSPDLHDEDGDGTPDYIQNTLPGQGHRGRVDRDGNGRPDFAEDGDGDGTPNFLDPDARTDQDGDGDGVNDDDDVDDDNDGEPDYAEA